MEPTSAAPEPFVHFCDLCQESVPVVELSSGRAVDVRGRLVCSNCRRRLVPATPGAWLAAVLAALALVAALAAAWLVERSRQGIHELSSRAGGLEQAWKEDLELLTRLGGSERQALSASLAEEREHQRAVGKRLQSMLGQLLDDMGSLESVHVSRSEEFEQMFTNLQVRLGALEKASRAHLAWLERIEAVLRSLLAAPRSEPDNRQPVPGPEEPVEKQPSPELARLEAELSSPDADKRWRALEQLEEIGGPLAARLVSGVLGDPDLWVRRLAAEVLGKLGEEIALEGLIRTLADEEVIVRAAAIASLRRLTGEDHGFDPQGSAANRRGALLRWQAWWEGRAEK